MENQYGFNLGLNRFDTHVMTTFKEPSVSRLTRDRLISEVREGKLDHLLLKRVRGLEGLSNKINDQAAINVIDFHFEHLVLRHMAVAQLSTYCKDIEKTLHMEVVKGISVGTPLWIDTVHHACVFSTMPQLAIHLANQYSYRKLVLIHQGDRPEPRLGMMGSVIKHVCGVDPDFIKLAGNWFATLTRLTTPETAIFYMVDMPVEISQSRAPKANRTGHVKLTAPENISLSVQTLFGSKTFANRLGASHVVLEYPRKDRARVRPYVASAPTIQCPLEDWVFWPLLKRL